MAVDAKRANYFQQRRAILYIWVKERPRDGVTLYSHPNISDLGVSNFKRKHKTLSTRALIYLYTLHV